MTSFLFSGQVSECVGMGKDFFDASPEARDLFDQTSQRCGVDLAAVIFSGSEDAIHANRIAQPGVFLVSTLATRELSARGVEPSSVAGYSLGNYAALVASGAMSFDDALTVLLAVERESGLAAVSGAMAAVIGVPVEDVASVCGRLRARGLPVWIGNVNAATQLILTGTAPAVAEAIAELSPRALKCLHLPMTWPIHSPLFEEVSRAIAPVVAGLSSLAAPRVPLYAGHVGRRIETVAEIADLLTRQVMLPSYWKETLESIAATGERDFLEVGPGDMLTRILRWTVRDGRCRPAGSLGAVATIAGHS